MPFNPRPVNPASPAVLTEVTRVHRGLDGLAALIRHARAAKGAPLRVRCDGMWGVDWEQVHTSLEKHLRGLGLRTRALLTASALRPEDELKSHFYPWLTDNPVFGRVCDRPLTDYFRPGAYVRLAADFARESGDDVVFLFGPYAISPETENADLTLYVDLPREDIAAYHERGGLNLGFCTPASTSEKYKVAYYVEWPLLERHKKEVLPRLDYYISAHGGEFKWVAREGLYRLVEDVSSRPFRCKPYFMPGVWGGQRIKQVANLPESWVNCAWDFEIVAPENAITIGVGEETLTIPFHIMMWISGPRILGELATEYFGDYFPIRFNYLDTMDGSNLSVQVHPHASYIRERFNEPIPQDETYYVVENKPGARVYLGLREHVTRESFRRVVERAEKEHIPFDIDEYVASWESKVGGYYLIPAGTVHCSGANNLVLEISATPYWYTFKIYDYLRPDLNGKPRPINYEFAFDVIDFTRKENWVKRHLIPKPRLLREEQGGREVHLGSSPFTFFGLNRLEFNREMTDRTAGTFHVITPVKGEGIDVVLADGFTMSLSYLETGVVPESVGTYRLVARGGPVQVVKAYIKQ